jgi:hypothetical protein
LRGVRVIRRLSDPVAGAERKRHHEVFLEDGASLSSSSSLRDTAYKQYRQAQVAKAEKAIPYSAFIERSVMTADGAQRGDDGTHDVGSWPIGGRVGFPSNILNWVDWSLITRLRFATLYLPARPETAVEPLNPIHTWLCSRSLGERIAGCPEPIVRDVAMTGRVI